MDVGMDDQMDGWTKDAMSQFMIWYICFMHEFLIYLFRYLCLYMDEQQNEKNGCAGYCLTR